MPVTLRVQYLKVNFHTSGLVCPSSWMDFCWIKVQLSLLIFLIFQATIFKYIKFSYVYSWWHIGHLILTVHSWQKPFLSKLKLVCFISFIFSLLCRNGSNRFLTVSKKTVSAGTCSTVLNLTSNATHHIEHLLKKFPLNIKERQELQPKTERSTVTFDTGV